MNTETLKHLAASVIEMDGRATKAECLSLRPSVDDFGIDIIVVECSEPNEKGQIASFDREPDADFFIVARTAAPKLARAVMLLLECVEELQGTPSETERCETLDKLEAALAALDEGEKGMMQP